MSNTFYLDQSRKRGVCLGLERISKIMLCFGNPHDKYATVHVTGTNGKGSTVTMISSILSKSGYIVGTYTSPGLISDLENIHVNGVQISESEFNEILHDIYSYDEKINTYPY